MVQISDLNATQLANAQAIYSAALPYGRDAIMAALMAAGDEASWLRYANNGLSTRSDVTATAKRVAAVSMSFDHDAVAGAAWTTADSVGLYQQRPSFGYGTVAELMDPYRSTIIFLTGNAAHTTRAFINAPTDLTLAQRVQWTQGSEFPTGDNYAPFETVAAQLIEQFSSGVDIPTSLTVAAQLIERFSSGVDIPTSLVPAGNAPAALTEWITMADQTALDAFASEVRDPILTLVSILFANEKIEGQPYTKTAANFNDVRELLARTEPRVSQVDGGTYPQGDFLVSIDRKLSELLAILKAKP